MILTIRPSTALICPFRHRTRPGCGRAATAPGTWTQWRMPGTWLDSHLRLRSLIAHEVGKAYWDDRIDIRYDAIDIERYLWGAR